MNAASCVREQSDQAKVEYNNINQYIRQGYADRQITTIKTRYRTTFAKFQAAEEALCIFEDEYRIETRWTTDSKEYTDALVLMGERKYRSALAELERLVVARLFELTKLGMGGVGVFISHCSTN